jgi:hypothetical protein
METILQHNISEQPMERGVQTCLRENTKYGNADYVQKPDGSKIANIMETTKFMIEQIIPEDNAQDDTEIT